MLEDFIIIQRAFSFIFMAVMNIYVKFSRQFIVIVGTAINEGRNHFSNISKSIIKNEIIALLIGMFSRLYGNRLLMTFLFIPSWYALWSSQYLEIIFCSWLSRVCVKEIRVIWCRQSYLWYFSTLNTECTLKVVTFNKQKEILIKLRQLNDFFVCV